MNCISTAASGFLRYGALHFSKDAVTRSDNIKNTVDRDLNDSGLDKKDLEQNVIIIDLRGEGQCDKVIAPVVQYLRSIPVKQVAVVFNAKVDTAKLDYPAVSITAAMADHGSWFSNLKNKPKILDTDCDFLCLMRSPNRSRAKLANRLLSEVSSLRISFGSMCESHELVQFDAWLPNRRLPLLLDGPVVRDSRNLEHAMDNPIFRKCAINVVAETSSQWPDTWNSIFVTEKTFKAFGMFQLPIWWAVPGLVKCVRSLGFDLFDDVIDHSYDNENDEDRRLDMVIYQIKQLESINPTALRDKFKHRLYANWQKLDELIETLPKDFNDILSMLAMPKS